MKSRKFGRVLAGWMLIAGATNAGAAIIIDNATTGLYNNGIGTSLHTAGATDPICGAGCIDGAFNYPAAPDLTGGAAALGNWLTTPGTPGGSWGAAPQAIPGGWAVGDETAVIYEINAGTGLANLSLRLGVDNGIFVWLDGSYLFGARAAGGSFLGEYALNLPSLTGVHHLQILREDHGGATGYAIELTGDRRVIQVPAPGVLALLGLGLVSLGVLRRHAG